MSDVDRNDAAFGAGPAAEDQPTAQLAHVHSWPAGRHRQVDLLRAGQEKTANMQQVASGECTTSERSEANGDENGQAVRAVASSEVRCISNDNVTERWSSSSECDCRKTSPPPSANDGCLTGCDVSACGRGLAENTGSASKRSLAQQYQDVNQCVDKQSRTGRQQQAAPDGHWAASNKDIQTTVRSGCVSEMQQKSSLDSLLNKSLRLTFENKGSRLEPGYDGRRGMADTYRSFNNVYSADGREGEASSFQSSYKNNNTTKEKTYLPEGLHLDWLSGHIPPSSWLFPGVTDVSRLQRSLQCIQSSCTLSPSLCETLQRFENIKHQSDRHVALSSVGYRGMDGRDVSSRSPGVRIDPGDRFDVLRSRCARDQSASLALSQSRDPNPEPLPACCLGSDEKRQNSPDRLAPEASVIPPGSAAAELTRQPQLHLHALLNDRIDKVMPIAETLPRPLPAPPANGPPPLPRGGLPGTQRAHNGRARMRSRAARRKRMALSLDLSLVLDVVLKDSHSTPLTAESEEDGLHTPALLEPRVTLTDETTPSGSSSTSGRSLYSRPQSLNEYTIPQDGISLIKAELKVVGKEPELLADEHRQYRMMSLSPPELPKSSLSKDVLPSLLPSIGHDYDRIKAECDRMNNELQSLEKKYDQAVKTSNMYHQQYKVTKEKLDQVTADVDAVKVENCGLVEDKTRLEAEVEQLTRLRVEDKGELDDLRRQQLEAMNESGSFEGFSTIYDQAVSRYETLKLDYDSLRKQYTDTVASLNTATSKTDRLQEDNDHLRKQLEQLKQEKNSAYQDRKILQQHVTLAIQAANREKNDLLRELGNLKSERDVYRKKVAGLEAQTIQISKDMSRLKKERDAAVHEYSLVMSERDSVHKEMEQLQDKLTSVQKKCELSEKERKSLKDELDSVQREISTVLEQRERAIKQLNELKDKYGERRLDPLDQDFMHLDRFMPERSSGRREQSQDGKEIENLRKEVERLQAELRDVQQEKEDSKRRCDWAFTERDKIVRERESIRTLCDKLRHERDGAVSKLIEALRDTDELKKQRSDALKELKEVREKYETLVENEVRKGQLRNIRHNHSNDSAIDADLQEWETETLHIELDVSSTKTLGVDLVGGVEDPQYPDNAVFIANIKQDSCAIGKLKINDQLIKVNNTEIANVEKSAVYEALNRREGPVHVIIRRRRLVSTRSVIPIHINLTEGELGAQLEGGIFVSRIIPGSASAREGNLAVGDRILSVNGHSVENMTPEEVSRFAQSQGDHVTFNIIKYSLTPNSSVMLSSSPSSGHNLTESSPDGLSLSPRSPQLHHCSWCAPSPDSSNKANLSLKCSGSQTDSLDSPQPSVRSGWSDQDKLANRLYIGQSNRTTEFDLDGKKDGSQDICYPSRVNPVGEYGQNHHLDRRRHREQELHGSRDSEQRRRSHDMQDVRRSHDMTSQRSYDRLDQEQRSTSVQTRSRGEIDKKKFLDKALIHFQKQPHGIDRKARDHRCKSGHPFFSIDSGHTSEDQVIDELNAIIDQYESAGVSKSTNKPQTLKHQQENGGTWPKCRVNLEQSNSVWTPSSVIKARPPVPDVFQETSHAQSSYQHQDSKLPPMPPERNDSFKRSASIKHSPQNSDSSKYSHYGMSSPSKSSHQTTFYTSPSKSCSATEEKKPSKHLENSWTSSSADDYKDSSSVRYSPHSSANSSTQESLDYSVKSANNQQDLSRYVRKPNRPTSAPNQSRSAKMKARAEERRRESQENHGQRSHSRSKQLQEIAEMLSHDAQIASQDYVPQKPKSLDIQPMYSPRPLPHSGHNITPSSAVSSSGYLSGKQNHPLSSSGSGPLSPHDKTLAFPGQLKSPSSYPASVPAAAHVLRSTNIFSVANSQVVSSPASGAAHHSTSSPMSSQPLGPRYGSPTGHYMKGSGSSILNSSIPEVESENMGVYHVGRSRFSTPSPSPSQQSSSFDHCTPVSDDFPYEYVHQRAMQGRHSHHVPSAEGNSTFPNRRTAQYPDRFRVPSSQSVISSHRSVTSSVERVSGHSSPVSPSYIPGLTDYLHLPPGNSHSLPKAAADTKHQSRPHLGETRNIKFEKTIEPLGIQIKCGSLGGIFVSSVSDNSLANKAGINVGDQLLEVCGINMRNATKDLAARVLQQCGGSINMLVQYNPNKYQEETDGSSGPCSESSTPNTPDGTSDHKVKSHRVSDETLTSDTVSPHPHSPASLTPIHSIKSTESYPPMEPRFVMLKKTYPHESLGVTLVGGNAVGIFVRSVQPNSVSGGRKGLRYGDQILEYNGINFRNVTHEQAAVEIAKPAETVSILAQYNIQRLNKILDQPGDALYIRALFDHQAESEDQLGFNKNDILFVDNTLYNGMLGVWRAWIVDDSGNKLQCGVIPSKSRLEDELSLRRSQSEVGEDELSKSSRRGSASARRSFFRKKKHQRSNSRDSRELNSFSDASINSDSVPFLDDSSVISYERVERLDSKVCRPVLILAPLAEPLINKLTSESPDKYCRCEPEIIKATISSLETGQNEGLFVDFKSRSDGQFECITVQSIRDIISKNRHCLLNVHPDAIEHLHKVSIYPIVLFIKHKTSKEIREVKDTRFLPEKLSNKTAKEYFEMFQKYEQKYKRLFSESLSGGNLAYMCRAIKSSIDQEQQKTLWVPSGSL